MEKKGPLVSVIMPCYNHEAYVGAAIESILNQTYENIELIVLDNGSTDNSLMIIKQYENQIDKILHFDKNDLPMATHELLKESTGEYIAFMTSDDYWKEEKLEKQMKVFTENKKLKACFTWTMQVDEQLNTSKNLVQFNVNNRSRFDWLEMMITGNNYFAYPSAVVKKEDYEEELLVSGPFWQLGDKYLWLRMLMRGEVYVVEEPLVFFRWHKGPHENTSTPNMENSIRNMNEDMFLVNEVFRKMKDDIFKEVFGKHFINPNVCTHEEIVCEKFFVLLNMTKTKPYLQQSVLDFYYENCRWGSKGGYPFAQLLEEKYNYTFKDFLEYNGKNGVANYVYTYSQVYNQYETTKKRTKVKNKIFRDIINSDMEREERKIVLKKSLYQVLPSEVKEQMELLLMYMEQIFSYIEQSESIIDITQLLLNIRAAQPILDNLYWETDFLELEIEETEWEQYQLIMIKENITQEEFGDIILPFLIKCVIELRACQ